MQRGAAKLHGGPRHIFNAELGISTSYWLKSKFDHQLASTPTGCDGELRWQGVWLRREERLVRA